MTSQVAPHPTALLHLHLEGLAQDIGHSQVAMLCSFLQAYFPQGDYNFSQLSFNLGTPESMDAYDKAASDLANTLSAYSRVVLFLTTHSDEDRGDLFTGYINKKPVAYKVLPFLQLLLKPLSKIINGADIIFYVCGSVVTNPQSCNGVKEVAQQSMLLFDAQHLQLASTVPYLQSLLDNTIIQGFPISSAAKVALNDWYAGPKYVIQIQAQIPAALCAIHNFICIHNADEVSDEDANEDPVDISEDLQGAGESDTIADSEVGTTDTAALQATHTLHDQIAEEMWEDYQERIHMRDFKSGSDEYSSDDMSL
ncbi:hypothetical protein EDD16DRAFT_1718451 [Pisolithus croceorrhizus]|nr:hypothetical protein EDD16DRAFT_1718451 [Pisolithus croceorrhizus]